MSSAERLYNLLPYVYRERDARIGEPLRALCGVLQTELDRIEGDIDQLYDDWFIETCQEWLVPYIGDLLGVPALETGNVEGISLRGYVANTLAYRRRKGTAAVVEQVARDTTGWPARAFESFLHLVVNANLDHFRTTGSTTADVRNANAMELIGGPLGPEGHTVDVRNIGTQGGRFNVGNLPIHLYRMQAHQMERANARQSAAGLGFEWYIHPLGRDLQLFNRPKTEEGISGLAKEINLPVPLRKRALHAELQDIAATEDRHYFGTDPVIRIWEDGTETAVSDITIMSLNGASGSWPAPPAGTVGLDPELGRIRVSSSATSVEVTYSQGSPADLGGGPYPRGAYVEAALGTTTVTWQRGVSQLLTGTDIVSSLTQALTDFNNHVTSEDANAVGLIVVMDNATYGSGASWTVTVPEGSQLHVVAADWPALNGVRSVGDYSADARRPVLHGDINISVPTVLGDSTSSVHLNGFLIAGRVTVTTGGELSELRLSHCSVVTPASTPQASGLVVDAGNECLEVVLERSILHGVQLPATVPTLQATDCILDLGDTVAVPPPDHVCVEASGTAALLKGCTLMGASTFRQLSADDTLFTGTVTVSQKQEGCVRYSYVAADSVTPRRYKCLPDEAVQDLTDTNAIDAEKRRLVPRFVSTVYGDDTTIYPDYARLHPHGARELKVGAEHGGEMGAFAHLREEPRLTNLRNALSTYLRFGMHAGFFFET